MSDRALVHSGAERRPSPAAGDGLSGPGRPGGFER